MQSGDDTRKEMWDHVERKSDGEMGARGTEEMDE